ncbi:Ubiquitin specific protease domain [Phytophthora cactorum]|nr:Ubiquitin specific protease domain [Phytophthora cactorum]
MAPTQRDGVMLASTPLESALQSPTGTADEPASIQCEASSLSKTLTSSTSSTDASSPQNNSRSEPVDFAALYQRSSRDSEMFSALQTLGKELEEVGSQHRAQQQTHNSATDVIALRFAPDQLQQLLTTQEAGGAENAAGKEQTMQPHPPRAAEAKGKPMRRFQTSSATPFVLTAATGGRPGGFTDSEEESDAQYHKVQQLPWEENIIWGIDFNADAKGEKVEDNGVEVEDSVGGVTVVQEKAATKGNSWAKATEKNDGGLQTYKQLRVARGQETGVSRLNEENFDMTKPRNYRWELEDSSKETKKGEEVKENETQTLPCPLNKELQDDSWVAAIGWKSTQDMPESKLVLDDNDASLIYSVSEMEDFGEETAEGRLGTEGSGKKSKDTRVVKNIGYVHHSLPAMKLSLTKPELPKTKLRDFHRPRGKFKINERLEFLPPPPGAAKMAPQEESAMVTQIKKSSDLNPIAGGKLILIEYTEQHPPMLSNPGMASRILHYWRPPEDTSAGLGILGKKKARKTRPKPPDMKMGQVITLGDHDESPFVGDIPPGRVVTSLNSKLYKVPIFPHKPTVPFAANSEARERNNSDIFLMCRSITKGQIEPQIEVPAPNSRSANEFIRPYMSFHILRLFKKASDGERLKIEDIARAFPNQSGTAIRKRMKEVATFERGGNDSGWWKKKAASQLQSEEEIRASIPPESVCLYESMMSGHRRLLDIGLTKLFTPSGVNGAINHMIRRLELRKNALSTRLIPANLERRAREKAQAELWKKDPVVRKLEKDIQVARYINEQLQLTPWNLTNNYVECHLQGKGSGMLQLGGIGDPTGRGEGFSFVRVPQSRAKKKDGEEDAAPTAESKISAETAAVQKAVAAVTGTTADLRKLKMKEAGDVLRNLGLADADIKKLRRWDRIHMVRELSSRATAHGVAGSLSKFARGARKSLSAQQQEYRKKCDVIYERQMDVLSSTKTTFSSDEESDGDDDLDELGADVEADILGGTDTKRGPKNLFRSGGGGLNRSKEVLAEREDAVELRRLMEEMNEDAGPSANAKPTSAGGTGASGISSVSGFGARSNIMSRGGSTVSSALATPTGQLSRVSSPTHGSRTPVPSEPPSASKKFPGRKVLKRVVRTIEEDGSETVRIQFIVDDKQVARFRAMQQRKDRQQKTDERNQLRKRKRMLALEDDGSLLDKAKRRKQLQEELKQLAKTEAQNRGYQEMLKKGEAGDGADGDDADDGSGKGVIRCTQCLQVGHMRTNRSCPLYMADEARSKKSGSFSEKQANVMLAEPLKLKVKKSPSVISGGDSSTKITVNLAELREGARKHHAEKKRKREMEVREQAELYKRPYAKGVVKQSRSRMPVEHVNNALEMVVQRLLEMPESEIFREPVDANTVQNYYQIVKQPMDLSTIRRKIEAKEYDSMREFVKDLELIVNNSRIFNGDPTKSVITANAQKVLRRARTRWRCSMRRVTSRTLGVSICGPSVLNTLGCSQSKSHFDVHHALCRGLLTGLVWYTQDTSMISFHHALCTDRTWWKTRHQNHRRLHQAQSYRSRSTPYILTGTVGCGRARDPRPASENRRVKMTEASLQSAASLVRVARASDRVYRDECVFSFDSALSPSGLYTNLRSFLSYGASYLVYDRSETPAVYLHQQHKRKPKASSSSTTEVTPTKLAIGGAGGFAASVEDKYELEKTFSIVLLGPDQQELAREALDSPSLPSMLKEAAEAVLNHAGNTVTEEVASWQEELKPTKYAEHLVQVPNPPHIASNPSAWKCQAPDCDKQENLWLNLSDGYIGCGRQNWDGSGGCGAALTHYTEGGDVYSYAPDEDDMVKNPLLPKHLEHFGINVNNLKKTDKSMNELQVGLNLSYEFDAVTEAGKKLVPVSGAGYMGFKNLGNSCYMNSVLQLLLALPEVQERYFKVSEKIFSTTDTLPVDDFAAQFAKLTCATLTDRYKKQFLTPKDSNKEVEEDDIHNVDLRPITFRGLVGKGHPDFSTGQQQDAVEYLQAATANLFKFKLEDRVQCMASNKVKYVPRDDMLLQLQIPLEAATNATQVSAYQVLEQKRQRLGDEKAEKSEGEERVVPNVPFEACIEKTLAPEVIEDFLSPATGKKGQAQKTVRFRSFPRYLLVQMRRFYVAEDWTPKKLEVEVKVPEKFSLSRFVSKGLVDGEEVLPEAPTASGTTESSASATTDATKSSWLSWCRLKAEGDAVNMEHVSNLMAMGFAEPHAKCALKQTDNNPDRAAEWLFSHMDDLDGAVAQYYSLVGFVSHVGKNTNSGHYVCHMKKDGRWIIFNDDKVAVSEEPPLGAGYLYLFRRTDA